jgi:cell division septation protein DedD
MTTEERKRPQAQRSGWLGTLAGAGLLVTVGFGVGLVAGTAYEEPELVAQHLAGRTVEVSLGPVEAPSEHPSADDVAAAPPQEALGVVEPLPTPLGAGALDEPRQEPLARPAAAARAAKQAAPGSAFAIQVGAFATEATAQQLAGELEKRGFPSYVTPEGTGARFKVRVGPIGSRSEAEQLSGRLKGEHRLPTWIMAGKS